jgi:hypothetical protein
MTTMIRGNAVIVIVVLLILSLQAAMVQAAPSSWPHPITVWPCTALVGITSGSDWRAGGLALADFGGDGQIDAAVTGAYVSGACIVKADGSQTWIGTGAWPVALAAADLDGDGDVDLAVAEQNGGGISILTNDGAGTMTRTAFYATGDPAGPVGPTAVLAVDIDKDSRLDLVVANRFAETVVVLHNTGGGFMPWQTIPVPGEPNALAAADLNNDGWPDIAVACASDDTVRILKNTDGFLARGGAAPAGPYPVAVAAADLNGDGYMDLAVADREAPQVTVLLSDGAGGFIPRDVMLQAPGYGAFDPPYDVQLVDDSRDGNIDIYCGGKWLRNDGDATFSYIHSESTGRVVYTKGFLPGVPYPFLGLGANGMVTVTYQAPPPLHSVPGDIDGDSHVDVLDLLYLVDSFGKSVGDTGFLPACDLNRDGTVDVADLLMLVPNFGV